MRKNALTVLVALPLSIPMAAAQTYQIENWPNDLVQVPCSAWTHNPDGSCTQTAPIMVNHSLFSGNTFKGGPEQAILDKR